MRFEEYFEINYIPTSVKEAYEEYKKEGGEEDESSR